MAKGTRMKDKAGVAGTAPEGSGRSEPEDGPNRVDVHVGSRVRLRRTLLGLSQMALAEAVGLTFQQVQKYEKGANRISASRLFQFSQVLDVPISFFYDDMEEPGFGVDATYDAEGRQNPMTKRETLELVRAYYRIPSTELRRKIFDLVKSISAANEPPVDEPVA